MTNYHSLNLNSTCSIAIFSGIVEKTVVPDHWCQWNCEQNSCPYHSKDCECIPYEGMKDNNDVANNDHTNTNQNANHQEQNTNDREHGISNPVSMWPQLTNFGIGQRSVAVNNPQSVNSETSSQNQQVPSGDIIFNSFNGVGSQTQGQQSLNAFAGLSQAGGIQQAGQWPVDNQAGRPIVFQG